MKVYIDIRCLQDDNFKKRGIGNHTLGILKHSRKFVPQDTELIGLIDYRLNLNLDDYSKYFDRITTSFAEAERNADVFLNACPFAPGQEKVWGILLNSNIYSSCLFYDLIPLMFPEKYFVSKVDKVNYLNYLLICSLYSSFISISKAALNELSHFKKVSEDKVAVTGASVSNDYLNKAYLNSSFKLPFKSKSYFIMVGGGDDRKNMDFALKAFGKLKKEIKITDLNFVLIGSYTDFQKNRFNLIASEYKFTNNLKVLSGVGNEELGFLFNNAIANICPSIAEGFFLPLVEGLACDCLPLSSVCEAQCEIIKNDKELIFTLENDKELTSLMKKVLTDKVFVEKKLVQYKSLASYYSEEEVSKRVWKKITDDLLKKKDDKNKTFNLSSKLNPKIAFVTPYPNDRSGCAEYSFATIKELSKTVDIDVFTDAEDIVKTDFVKSIRKVHKYQYFKNTYDAVISVIGNSFFHLNIYDNVINYGGYVIEHDNRLLDFINLKYGTAKTAEIASIELGKSVSEKDIYDWIEGRKDFETLFLNELYDSSKKMFFHSKSLIKNFERINKRKAEFLPFCKFVDYDFDNYDLSKKRELRKKLGIPDNEIVIATFGSVASSKLYEECLTSLSYLPKQNDKYYKMYFIGECHSREFERINEIATTHGLQVFVKPFHYFTRKEYGEILQVADIGIQLRRHKFGAISGSLMECISVGLKTVSNKDLALGVDAPNYVTVIEDDPTPEVISKGILTALQNPMSINDIKRSQQNHNSEHSFKKYSELLLNQVL